METPNLDSLPDPETRAQAFTLVCRLSRESGDHLRAEDHPDDLAGELREQSATARAAFRHIDEGLLVNDPDQVLALVGACRTLTEVLESGIAQLRTMSTLQRAEQLLGSSQYWLARSCGYRTLGEVDAAALTHQQHREETVRAGAA